jgi:hypothetical protein
MGKYPGRKKNLPIGFSSLVATIAKGFIARCATGA